MYTHTFSPASRLIFTAILSALTVSCASAAYPPLAHAAPPEEVREEQGLTETQRVAALQDDFRDSVGLLYGQDAQGTLRQFCTATAFWKEGHKYRFVTAAHCIAEDDERNSKVKLEAESWFITFDHTDEKNYYRADVLAVGYQHAGDDFAVLEVTLKDENIPVMSMATTPARLGEPIMNIASPGGLGKNLFVGIVSNPRLDRPVKIRSINWQDGIVLQTNVAGGSSGSAVVSVEQGGIIAFIVGHIGSGGPQNVIALPVQKFEAFWNAVRNDEYRYFKAPKKKEAKKKVKKKSKKKCMHKACKRKR